MNNGIRFTDEFKRDAVAQVVDRGYAVREVAGRLGIHWPTGECLAITDRQHQIAVHLEGAVCEVAGLESRGIGASCGDQASEARTGAGHRGT